MLQDVLAAMIKTSYIKGSANDVLLSVEEGRWAEFDDIFVSQKMRDFAKDAEQPETDRTKARAILTRTAPKLLVDYEAIRLREKHELKSFRSYKQAVKEKKQQWASEFDVDPDLWYIWSKSGLALTKVGSHVSQSTYYEGTEDDRDKYEQEIRVLDAAGVTSKSIVEIPHSLMSVLSNQALYSLRVYVLLPPEKMQLRNKYNSKDQG